MVLQGILDDCYGKKDGGICTRDYNGNSARLDVAFVTASKRVALGMWGPEPKGDRRLAGEMVERGADSWGPLCLPLIASLNGMV